MKIRLLALLRAAGLVALLGLAPLEGALAQSAAATPEATVKTAVESTLAAIKADPAAEGGDLARTTQLVRSKFLPYTDFRRTTRLVMGDAWKTTTPAQQEQVFQQFQTLLVRTYAAELIQVRDQNISFSFKPPAASAARATDAIVSSQVHSTGDDMSIGYRLGQTGGGWKIYDIEMTAGVWMIQIYRQQFSEQLQRGGVDGLIKFLAAHNAIH